MLSRKEQLALFKQNKLLKATAASKSAVQTSKAKAGSVRSKVHMSATKSTVFQSNTRGSAKNDRNVVMAGKKKIGSSTPIGKLQARLRAKAAIPDDKSTSSSSSNKENAKKCNKNLFGTDDDTDECLAVRPADKSAEIRKKLDEADYLNKKHGCHVARAYLEELPKDESCTHLQLLSTSLYWLAWIEIEKSAHSWERVEKLFLQADSLVRSSLDKAVVTAAYEKFRQEGDCILESKMDSLNQAVATVPPFVSSNSSRPKVKQKRKVDNVTMDNVQELQATASSSNNAFQAVNVANTRKNYEKIGQKSSQKDSDTVSITGVNVKSLSENLMSSMSRSRKVNAKHLAGGVALPCMLATTDDAALGSHKPQETPGDSSRDELSKLLGIDNDNESDNLINKDLQSPRQDDHSLDEGLAPSSAVLPPRKKVCRARAPVRVVQKSDDIFSDSDDDEEVYEDISSSKSAFADSCSPEVSEDDTQEEPQSKRPTAPRHQVQVAEDIAKVETTSRRVTRSGVCFAEQNYTTPSKKQSLDKKKKRKVTPFKPHIDDAILSPDPEE